MSKWFALCVAHFVCFFVQNERCGVAMGSSPEKQDHGKERSEADFEKIFGV
jgi:hypothetical protein